MATDHPRQNLNRRDALQAGAAGAGLLVAGGIVRAQGTGPDCVPTPAQTAGPFWVDERLSRADIRSDPETGELRPGLPLRLELKVSELSPSGCTPVAGCYVDVWHCDATGNYSGVGDQKGLKYLRGYQATDAQGKARFVTIFPGYYPGRTAHIHFRVRKFDADGKATFNFVGQAYFDDEVTDRVYARAEPYNRRLARRTRNHNDGIYQEACLMQATDNDTHAVAAFDIVINAEEGVTDARCTPTDPDSMEHRNDFGGGSPPVRIA